MGDACFHEQRSHPVDGQQRLLVDRFDRDTLDVTLLCCHIDCLGVVRVGFVADAKRRYMSGGKKDRCRRRAYYCETSANKPSVGFLWAARA